MITSKDQNQSLFSLFDILVSVILRSCHFQYPVLLLFLKNSDYLPPNHALFGVCGGIVKGKQGKVEAYAPPKGSLEWKNLGIKSHIVDQRGNGFQCRADFGSTFPSLVGNLEVSHSFAKNVIISSA